MDMIPHKMTNSHILHHEFDYVEPASLDEVVALLGEYGDRAKLLAGGTDLIVQLKMERFAPQVLIDIRRVPGLGGIAFQGGAARIGALTSIWTARHDPDVRAHYPALAEACASFSTTQVQMMGTLGGNLCNGSPASDSAPALIAFDAQAVVAGPGGERRLPLEEFFLAPGLVALQPGELLVGLELPQTAPGTGSAFLKVSRVAADIAKANAAVVVVRDGERVADCRLVFGSVAPRPLRARQAEAVLRGQVWSAELVERAAAAAAQEIAPIDDVRSTAWYRREVVRVMTHDALLRAWERAGQAAPGEFPQRPAERRTDALRTTRRVSAGEQAAIELNVNGETHRLWVAPNELLLNVLREKLHLTGAKYSCGIGECGACTVRIDGHPALSCLVLAIGAEGHAIVTVEGLQAADGALDPLQQAFIDHAAFQCGYCTPGMLMTARSLLDGNPRPTEDEVRDYMKGNLCRCTGYASIVRAVTSCARE